MSENRITANMIEEAFDSVLDSNDPGAEKLAKLAFDLQEVNEKLYRALDVYERERTRFRHAKPEFTGDFFISGKLGASDENGLPDKIEVCPSYGCAWVQVYEKTDKTISFEGS
jgi:hypothetical protein